MNQAAVKTVDSDQWSVVRKTGIRGQGSGINARIALVVLSLAFLAVAPRWLGAQDCLTCHGDSSMTDANGHSSFVDQTKFSSSIHVSL